MATFTKELSKRSIVCGVPMGNGNTKEADDLIALLGKTLVAASEHLDYCGYGDSWERECSGDLEKDIGVAIGKYEEYIK